MRSTKSAQRLCWNCEGSVHLEMERCPYCGTALDEAPAEAASFTPPYANEPLSERHIPEPPYSRTGGSSLKQQHYIEDAEFVRKEPSSHNRSQLGSTFQSLGFILAGSIFLIFGFLLYLYSEKEFLILKWNTDHWPYFFFSALPMLYLGWKSLIQSEEN